MITNHRKLELALLVLLCLSPCVRADNRVRSDQDMLRGAWVCVKTFKEGKAVESYVDVRAAIEADNLTWYFPQQDGSYREQKNKFRIDPTKQPKHFDWWLVDKPNSVDMRIYEVGDDVLRMATNLNGKTRPESFESARWQFICKRIPQDGSKVAEIKGWGQFVNPDGDCTAREEDGSLTIKLPAGKHDFWYGRQDPAQRFNAPRILQEVNANFALQVKISADWSAKPALPNGACSYAAGLLVLDSPQQYLRLERCYFIHSRTKKLSCFTTPLYDLKGKRVEARRVAEKVADPDFFKGRSTWLRIVRVGQKITTYISHDGQQWRRTGVLETEFPKKVQVGVLALNGSNAEFAATFEDFKLKTN